jgi:membrane-associated protease RseP (regulator of RpoE activity)
MARRGGEGGGAGNPMNVIIAAFIGLLVIVAIVTLGPVLGYKLETGAGGADIPATSNWSTKDPNAVEGSAVWQDNVGLGLLVLLVFFISLAIYYIRMIG